MEQERRAIRFGLVVIVFAVVWKLMGSGMWEPVADLLSRPRVASFLMYLETGRVASVQETLPMQTIAPTLAVVATEPATVPTTQPPRVTVTFSAEEGALTEVFNATRYGVDAGALVTQPLSWDLTQEGATVLIVHTHATESFTMDGEQYVESSKYRTLDERYNMVRVGEELAGVLESYGITVIHDRTLHDYPSYTGAYNSSRKAVEGYLKENPGIVLVLDLHRDSVELSNGSQMGTTATVNGKEAAQMMFVMGTDDGGLVHPRWRDNLALAVMLQTRLEQTAPGLMRPLYLRRERFNQDLLPGMLLVEMGAAGNTLQEALQAAQALGHAIGALRYGANLS